MIKDAQGPGGLIHSLQTWRQSHAFQLFFVVINSPCPNSEQRLPCGKDQVHCGVPFP
jgi:hypothetical protein